jgi:hypothetical protein
VEDVMTSVLTFGFPSEGVTVSDHDTGAALFDARDGRLFSTNLVGARIWRGLECRQEIGAIAADISREYDIEYVLALEQSLRFAEQLRQAKLVDEEVQR